MTAIEIAFFYAELGRPDYETMARAMVKSARHVMPDAHIVQLTDQTTAQVAGVSATGRYDLEIGADNLMMARTAMYAKHIRHATAPVIYCDVDCLWLREPEDFRKAAWDVAVLYRAGQPAMPYLGAMIYTRPNERALEFWSDWSYITASLPDRFHGWFCDQIALASILGLDGRPGDIITRKGCRIGILDAYEHAMIPTGRDQVVESVLVHYKGPRRKALMTESLMTKEHEQCQAAAV